jgi:hypothetical protein
MNVRDPDSSGPYYQYAGCLQETTGDESWPREKKFIYRGPFVRTTRFAISRDRVTSQGRVLSRQPRLAGNYRTPVRSHRTMFKTTRQIHPGSSQRKPAQPVLNICLIPRSACRVRSSFSISENRTCPSPWSPNPTPGLTATFASSSSFFENSIDPSARYCSGIPACSIPAPARPAGTCSSQQSREHSPAALPAQLWTQLVLE